MTENEYLEIKARIETGESERKACVTDRRRKAYRRYKARKERGEVSKFVGDFKTALTGDIKADVELLRKIGFQAASMICEKPAFIPVWREVMRAYCREFQEKTQQFTPLDYAEALKTLAAGQDEITTYEQAQPVNIQN